MARQFPPRKSLLISMGEISSKQGYGSKQSLHQKPLDSFQVFVGEIGLTGH